MECMSFDIEHRQGKMHTNADGLLKIQWIHEGETEDEVPLTDYSDIMSTTEARPAPTNVFEVKRIDIWQHNWTLGPLQGWSLKRIAEAYCISNFMFKKDCRPPRTLMDGEIENCGQCGRNLRDWNL